MFDVPASNFAGSWPQRISSIEDRGDHVAAADERRHRVEQRLAPVQDADPRRAVELVARPGVEVGIELAQVDRQLRNGLRAVDDDDRAGGVGALDDLGDRVDRAGGVGDVADGDELDGAGREQLVELLELEHALVVDLDHLELRAGLAAQHVPGHEVRVMLELGRDDAVAGPEVRAPPRVRDEVERLGRVLREDRAVGGPVDERGDAVARALEQLRRLGGEGVDAAVHGAAMVLVVVRHRIDDGLRRLRRRGRVHVDDALTLQRWEVRRQRRVGQRAHFAALTSSRICA